MVDVRAVYKGNSPILEVNPRGTSRSRSTREIAIRSRQWSENRKTYPPSNCALTVADSDAIVAGEGGDDMQ